jgi:hypothetical protein
MRSLAERPHAECAPLQNVPDGFLKCGDGVLVIQGGLLDRTGKPFRRLSLFLYQVLTQVWFGDLSHFRCNSKLPRRGKHFRLNEIRLFRLDYGHLLRRCRSVFKTKRLCH